MLDDPYVMKRFIEFDSHGYKGKDLVDNAKMFWENEILTRIENRRLKRMKRVAKLYY